MATSIDVIPAQVPINVTQGDTLTWTTTLTVDAVAVDLTQGDSISVIIENTVSQTNILVLSSDDDIPQIDVDGSGNAAVTITAAQTGEIDPDGYWYSLKWTNADGAIRTLHAGPFTVLKPIS